MRMESFSEENANSGRKEIPPSLGNNSFYVSLLVILDLVPPGAVITFLFR